MKTYVSCRLKTQIDYQLSLIAEMDTKNTNY